MTKYCEKIPKEFCGIVLFINVNEFRCTGILLSNCTSIYTILLGNSTEFRGLIFPEVWLYDLNNQSNEIETLLGTARVAALNILLTL